MILINSLKLPSGRIVGIIKRNWRPYCGILQASNLPDSTRHLFIPTEKRIPKIRIETRQFEKLINQRILVSIDCWPRESRYPLGNDIPLIKNNNRLFYFAIFFWFTQMIKFCI
jgi:exosome complex exonuclease DIS3/RRP44